MTEEEAKRLGKIASEYTLLQAPAKVIDGHAYFLPSDVKRAYIDGYKDENKNYEKQKEINKELVDDIAELKQQIKKLNGELEEVETNLQRERDLRRQDIQDGIKAVKELERAKEKIKSLLKLVDPIYKQCEEHYKMLEQAEQILKEEA